MFLWEAGPTLLSRKGYAIDVRRDCLALSLWLLSETHAAGDEKLLVLANKTPRRQPATLSNNDLSSSSFAPNLLAAVDAENLVPGGNGASPSASAGGGSGGGLSQAGNGGGNNVGVVQSASGGVADGVAARVPTTRGQCRSAHLVLVRSLLAFLFSGWGEWRVSREWKGYRGVFLLVLCVAVVDA